METRFTRTEDLIVEKAIEITRLILDLKYETDPREKNIDIEYERTLKTATQLLTLNKSEEILKHYLKKQIDDDLIEISFKVPEGERFTSIKILKNIKYHTGVKHIKVYINHVSSDVYNSEAEEFICIGYYEIEVILKLIEDINIINDEF